MREAGFFAGDEAPLKSWLDIVALGTVCDMVPLTGVNRLLVRQGFAQMQASENVGLNALIEVSGIKGGIEPYHAGFVLGPRINAGSRVHKSDTGAKLLSCDDRSTGRNIQVDVANVATISSGVNTMTVNALVLYNPAGTITGDPITVTLGAATVAGFELGGTLNVGAGQAAGTYTGNVAVTAAYN